MVRPQPALEDRCLLAGRRRRVGGNCLKLRGLWRLRVGLIVRAQGNCSTIQVSDGDHMAWSFKAGEMGTDTAKALEKARYSRISYLNTYRNGGCYCFDMGGKSLTLGSSQLGGVYSCRFFKYVSKRLGLSPEPRPKARGRCYVQMSASTNTTSAASESKGAGLRVFDALRLARQDSS